MPSLSPIILRLIRVKSCKNGLNDDTIKIFKLKNGVSYRVLYTDGDNKNISHMLDLDRNELDTYLRNLFRMLSYDTEPFKQLQVLAPGFPTVLLPVCDLYDVHTESLMDLFPLLSHASRVNVGSCSC